MRARRTRAGFSLLELSISVALMALVLTTALQISDSVADGSSTAATAARAEADAGRAVERLAEHLKGSGSGWIEEAWAPLVPLHDVTYTRLTGYDEDTATPELERERIFLERLPTDPDDGADNDGNGLADDCRVVWVRAPGTADELRTVVCNRVPESLAGEIDGNLVDDNDNGLVDERGLALDLVAGRVRIRLTVVERDQDARDVVRTVERTVWFRNETASE